MRLVGMIPVTVAALLLAACGDEAPKAPETAAPAVPMPKLEELPAPYNEADLASGKTQFGKKCGGCHFLEKARGNMVGPNLNGVFDRGTASEPRYAYSPAVKNLAREQASWTPELIDQWLQSPDSFVPGTSMRLNGITDVNERRDIIAFLLINSRQ